MEIWRFNEKGVITMTKFKIDAKSLIIGFLLAVIAFISIGAKSKGKVFDAIKAKSISIVDDNGRTLVDLSASKDGGWLNIFNNHGKTVCDLRAATKGGHCHS
ncbi:MAG: hypothetical protein M1536_01975 [Firmicutes bacterium]|nr:hypothetical protein [Bacillota bacterium]